MTPPCDTWSLASIGLVVTNSKALFSCSPISFRRHTITSSQKWWEKVHDDYLIKAKNLLAQSTQSDPTKAKKGKGEEDETRQGIKPPTKNAKDVKVTKGASNKVTDVKNRCYERY